jgi:outer membrane lipoprotein carrier protein
MKTLTTIILTILISTTTYSQYRKISNTEVITEKLNLASKNTKTIDSDFEQYKHMDILKDDIISKGHFSYKANYKVRWEYNTPYKYIIVMNGSSMWINDGKKTKKYDTNNNKMFKEINDLMVGMLQGKILNSNKFDVTLYENKTNILAKLKPKSGNMKEFLSEMELYFDKKTYNATMIIMNEASGDYTKIVFSDREINKELPNSIFLVR